MSFNLVVCGGTFDHFHKGHKEFLRCVFSVGKKIIVGITSDEYVKKSNIPTSLKLRGVSKNQISKIEPFEKRRQEVLAFIKVERVYEKTEIVEINDLFGPTLDKNLAIDAIVVSDNTKKGAEIINERRRKLGLKALNLFVIPRVLAEDGQLISSSRIRNGEIDREGKAYIKKEWFDKNLKLTENLREEFKKPFGDLLMDISSLSKDKNNLVITVGDITTKIFNEKSLGQNMSVIDFKVARKKKFSNISELGFNGQEKVFKVDNPPGHITSSLFKKLSGIFKSEVRGKVILYINGEEDLTVLPLILLSPLNTIIYYGQSGKGVVKVVVSEESKARAYDLMSQFKVSSRACFRIQFY